MGAKTRCWEHLACGQQKCPAYQQESVVCWLEPNTSCSGDIEPFVTNKFESCIQCPVFKMSIADDEIRVNITNFYRLLKEEELRPNTFNNDLALHFAEICNLLSKLSKGDFSVRLSLGPAPEMLMTLKNLLNELAEQMQEYVEETHELAMGACEHFETLNRIARNELSARAREGSSNELIAKLGSLINKCTDSLTSSISRLEVAEEETRNAYQQLLDIVEYLPDATFVIDREGRIIAWNRALEELTGVRKKEMLGQGDHAYSIPIYGCKRKLLIDYLDNEEDKLLLRQYTNIRRTDNTLSAETTITPIRPENIRHVWVTATALFDRSGNTTGGIESIRDVTELKRSEEDKNKLEAQLYHSKQMEALMLRLGHDLKTPLTPLFTLLPLLRERVDPEIQRMVDICSSSTNHIMNLCDRAMSLASLSSSEETDLPQKIRLKPAVAVVCEEYDEMLLQKALRCEVRIPSDICILAVPDQLKNLVSHILANAVKASPSDSRITITARKKAKMVEVAVRDRGVGLEPSHRERIFEEFFKVDDARHDLSSSGLGLSICKRIVHNHGGSIHAESKGLGYGTAVVFTMPEGICPAEI